MPRLPSPEVATLLAAALRQGPVTALLRGGSMAPCIPHGSRVTFVGGERARMGDVVLAVLDGRLLVHRVVDVAERGERLRIQGDSLAKADGWVHTDDVLGIAVKVHVGKRTGTLQRAHAGVWRAAGRVMCLARARLGQRVTPARAVRDG